MKLQDILGNNKLLITIGVIFLAFWAIGPLFFDKATLNVLTDKLPEGVQNVMGFILLDVLFYLMLTTFIRAIFAMSAKLRTFASKSDNNHRINVVMRLSSIVISTGITILLFF